MPTSYQRLDNPILDIFVRTLYLLAVLAEFLYAFFAPPPQGGHLDIVELCLPVNKNVEKGQILAIGGQWRLGVDFWLFRRCCWSDSPINDTWIWIEHGNNNNN